MKHKHKCENESCGAVWEHDSRDPNRSHLCPVCNLFGLRIYYGPEAVTSPAEIVAMRLRRNPVRVAGVDLAERERGI